MSLEDDIARLSRDAKNGKSSLTQGTCVGINWTLYYATINVNGGTNDIPMVGLAPNVGDKVWVGFLGNSPICLGPIPKPTTGTVQGPPTDAGKVDVEGDDGVIYRGLTYEDGYEPDTPHRVVLDWSVPSGFVVGRLSSDAVISEPPVVADAPSAAAVDHSPTFNPSDSGSWYTTGSKWQTTDVICSDHNEGCYFYDGQLAGSIPDDATIESVSVYLNAKSVSGGAPTLGLHNLSSKSGGPTITDAVTISTGSGWKDLPTSFGDALKTGAKLGIGFAGGGYHTYSPAGQSNSGVLTIKWSR